MNCGKQIGPCQEIDHRSYQGAKTFGHGQLPHNVSNIVAGAKTAPQIAAPVIPGSDKALWGCLIASRQGPKQSEALLEAPWFFPLRRGLLFATPQRDTEPRRVDRPEEKWPPLPSADGAHREADHEGRGKRIENGRRLPFPSITKENGSNFICRRLD
ncbi:hypothetical protein Baya_11324 [Bagarius yarrelli]|uniref:Uncharacterized protein n=1 Tax=Bagarius yarrelli TaxID=175774 RepID=A0A556UZW8_BAGYA|nr:hypothetical protein Baya_11324 [Bagarius yarrelli]